MYWKRFAHAFLLGTGICVLGAGCSAFNALVNSPAGSGAERNSPERMAAIGRVFENQGRYAQAQTMYRRTLKAQPGNTFVRQRLQYLASRNSNRSFNAEARKTAQAVAAADSVPTQKKNIRQRPPLEATTPPRTPEPPVIRVAQATDSEKSAVVPTGGSSSQPEVETARDSSAEQVVHVSEDESQGLFYPDAPAPELPTVADTDDTDVALPLLPVAEDEEDTTGDPAPLTVAAEPEIETPDSAEGEIELAAVSDDSAAQPAGLNFAPGKADQNVTPVAFEDTKPDTSGWKSTVRQVTLTEILAWLDSPVEFESELITALRHGEDEGVRSLAASALAECTGESTEDELRAASQTESELVRVTAVESLMSRGSLRERDVDTLVALLAGENADIRAQAAGCLRFLSGSDHSALCVDGLVGLLQDPDPGVVAMAATTLGDFGSEASTHRNSLVRLQGESDSEFVIEAAGLALQRIPSADSAEPAVEAPSEGEQDDAAMLLPVTE